MYLTYERYKEYGGTLSEPLFDEFAFEAESIINRYTFNRLKGETDFSESVKRCMFKLIKILFQKSELVSLAAGDSETDTETEGTAKYIASQSNDGVSVSYNVISASEALASSEKEITNTVNLYLSGAYNSKGLKLTYRGMYPGEERRYFDTRTVSKV